MNDQISKLDALNEKPLVTFALFAYNQEQYIREAVKGALSQTYSPLQIILSDDNSSDRTFEIMQEIASQYRGPHQIDMNRNHSNQGIGGHINKLMSLAKGEFIVIAAGDDISLPKRTEVLIRHWIHLGKKPDSIHSSSFRMAADGSDTGKIITTSNGNNLLPEQIIKGTDTCVIGASHAWSSRVFQRFGQLHTDVAYEDRAISFRSALMGGVAFIEKPLVRWREGGISSPSQILKPNELITHELRRWRRYLSVLTNMDMDMRNIGIFNSKLSIQLSTQIRQHQILICIYESKNPLATLWNNRHKASYFVLKQSIKAIFPKSYIRLTAILWLTALRRKW